MPTMPKRTARPLLFRWLDSIEADERLKRPVRHTALALAREMDVNGQHAFPSHQRLSERVGCDERTIRRHLDTLRELGWITWMNFRRDGVMLTSNHYTPLIPDGREVDTRKHADKLMSEMSEDYSGETYYETDVFSDNLAIDTRNAYVDMTVVWLRQHFSAEATDVDGHTRLREAVTAVYARHGIEGLRKVIERVDSAPIGEVTSIRSLCRVIAYRVTQAQSRIDVTSKTVEATGDDEGVSRVG